MTLDSSLADDRPTSSRPEGPARNPAWRPTAGSFYRLQPLEVAGGWVSGVDPPDEIPPADALGRSPRSALEQPILTALQRTPCLVSFSGGRDSSAMLALAVVLARREGLPLPVPISQRFRRAPDSQEHDWQSLVIGHLGVTDWVRQDFDDELEVLGPVAQDGLRRHGLLWPALIHGHAPLLSSARGGSIVSGEGGDEVLGSLRISPIVQVMRRRARMDRRAAKVLAATLGPRPIRAAALHWSISRRAPMPWLRPQALRACLHAAIRDEVDMPLRWDRAVVQIRRRRAVRAGLFQNLDLLARDADVRYVHPLLDAGFLHALARFGGRLGLTSRTEAMRMLFGDVLPDAVLARTSKARFNRAAIGEHSAAFISEWAGTGVDLDLVDPSALASSWRTPPVDARTLMLLQSAWLADQAT